jgi:hypothetical protein
VAIEDDRLWELLRSLDDSEHLKFPAGYDHSQAESRFNRLVNRLDAAFSCACQADRHVEDASYHGSIDIPAKATATGSRLVVIVSNFGDLAVVVIDNPGTWTQAEFAERLHPPRCRANTGSSRWPWVQDRPGGAAVAALRRKRAPPALCGGWPGNLVDPVL